MSKGIIGIFKCAEKGDEWCSVSVRAAETSEKLKNALQSEHPDLKLELVGAFGFECKGEIVEVETELRELLVQAFDKYVPSYKEWEFYRADRKKINTFIGNILSLCKTVTKFE